MSEDKKVSGFFEDSKKKPIEKPKVKQQIGKVYAIRGGKIIVDVSGNGCSMDFDEIKHKDLKVGDEIAVS